MAVLAGECRDPERTIGRATLIAAPIIAVMFILGTSAVLAFSSPAQVDLIAPIPQTITRGLGTLGIASIVAPLANLMLTSRLVANSSIVFTGQQGGAENGRPQVVHGLPAFSNSVNSILFVGAVSLAFGLAGISGWGTGGISTAGQRGGYSLRS